MVACGNLIRAFHKVLKLYILHRIVSLLNIRRRTNIAAETLNNISNYIRMRNLSPYFRHVQNVEETIIDDSLYIALAETKLK